MGTIRRAFMFFQRLLSVAARPRKTSLGFWNAGAVCVLLLVLTANDAVFAQVYPYRSGGARRGWNVGALRDSWNGAPTGIPSRVEPDETTAPRAPERPANVEQTPAQNGVLNGATAGRPETGIPSRLETGDASTARRAQDLRNVRPTDEAAGNDSGWAVSGGDAQNRRDVATGAGRQNERVERNVANVAPPSVAVSLPFARRATREELERWRASEQGTLVAIPRANFLKSGNGKKPGEADAPTGIDATSQAVATRDAVEAPSTESVASALSVPNANPVEVGADEYVVFTLSNLPPDEAALLRDAEDGRWDEIDLFDAALIAEGLTTRERRAPQREKFDRFSAELATLTERETDPLKKTKIVYEYLHDVVLTEKYNLNCSSLVASLETGVFNCVSATALFNCFAARSGLNVAALETTGHAKSRVKFADSFLDLETTCSSWDRLPDKARPYSRPLSTGDAILQNVSFERRDPSADEGTTTFDAETSTPDAPLGYSYTRTRKPMREIGDVELVATIYYNVGVDFYQKERFEEAIVAYVKAARLAPNNQTILGNLKATVNNWAIQIAMKDRDFERAILVAEQGLVLDPNFPEYKMNLPIFFHRWVDDLARDNRWDEAKRVEREYLKRFPKPTPQ